MSKRFGATTVSIGAARRYAYEARCRGSDHADIAGDCERPVFVPVVGVRDKSLAWLTMLQDETSWPGTDYAAGYGWVGHQPEKSLDNYGDVQHATLAVRCRDCAACWKARAALWRIRSRAEVGASERTWFVTLTCRPEVHWSHTAMCHRDHGGIWSELNDKQRWRKRCEPLLREHQLFMKRVRKHAPGLRYFLVVEKHKSGEPHLHMLLHETVKPVRWKDIDASWRLGFHVTKLVGTDGTGGAANYVCKYLTKSAAILRASTKYGDCSERIVSSEPSVLRRKF